MLVLRTFQDPRYESRFVLGGRTYVFTFMHNERLDRWYLTVSTESGETVVGNRKLVCGVADLFARETRRLRPPGALLVAPVSKGIDSPRLADIGEEYALIYIEPGDTLATVGT